MIIRIFNNGQQESIIVKANNRTGEIRQKESSTIVTNVFVLKL